MQFCDIYWNKIRDKRWQFVTYLKCYILFGNDTVREKATLLQYESSSQQCAV